MCAVIRDDLTWPDLGQCSWKWCLTSGINITWNCVRNTNSNPSALDSSGSHNKVPQTRWLNVTSIYSLILLESGSMKSRCWQNCALFPTLRESFLSSSSFCQPQMSLGSLSSDDLLLPLCLCLHIVCSSSCKDSSHTELGFTLMISKNLCPNKITFTSTGG